MASAPRFWKHRGALACTLWPLSLLHGALVSLRRALYRQGILKSTRVPVPVIVVGNVIAGGAGKTPVTIAVVRHLQSRGWRPGVISRGYGRDTDDCRVVQADQSNAADVGDEPLLIARACRDTPVWVAAKRAEAATALLKANPQVDVIVCDDGLQHLALQRDLEICVFNSDGVGNGWLLPAGPLREPWPRAVDLVLYAGNAPESGHAPQFELQRALAGDAIDVRGEPVALASLRAKPLHAVAAIARPEDFFSMLRARGLELAVAQALPDHADFKGWKSTQKPGLQLICTEKDAVKLWAVEPQALAARLEIQIPEGFFHALDALLRRYHRPLAH